MQTCNDSPQTRLEWGNAGKERPKGSRNRTTSTVKAIIEEAVEGLGGTERLMAWVRESRENERGFWWSIFPRLLPLRMTGKDEGAAQDLVTHSDRPREGNGQHRRAHASASGRMGPQSPEPANTQWPAQPAAEEGTVLPSSRQGMATTWVDIWVDRLLRPNHFILCYQLPKLKRMVPEARVELARLAAEDFESPASTVPPLGPTRLSYPAAGRAVNWRTACRPAA